MEFIQNLKQKIKQTGVESKKYLADPEHPYHNAAGFIKFQIICGYIGIALSILSLFVLIYYFSKYDLLSLIRLYGRYLGVASIIFYILLFLEIGLYVALFVLNIIMLKKLKNKETDYLFLWHFFCVIGYAILFIALFFNFRENFFRVIWFTILVGVFTYYYCVSVKARVYFGGDDILKKDRFIHFLLDDTIITTPKEEKEVSKIDNAQQNIVVNNTPPIVNECKSEKVNNNKIINTKDVNTKQQTVKLADNSNRKVASQQVKYEYKNYDMARRETNNRPNQYTPKKKQNVFVRVLTFLLSTIIKLMLLVIIVFTLINYDNKYNISNIPFFKSVFTVMDNFTSKIFVQNDENNTYNFDETRIIEETTNERVNKEQVETRVKETKKETISREEHITNEPIPAKSESSATNKISRNAVKLSSNVKKIDLKGAAWQFNKKQNAWNLLINKKVSKDVVYIIDYINPITGEPCSSTYGFDVDGRMIVGWGVDVNGEYYYFDDSTFEIGKMCTGWKKIEDDYYFFMPNGKLLTDAYTTDGYYVDINGKRVTNDGKNSSSNNESKQKEYKNKGTR